MKFVIEQIALNPPDPEKAIALLHAMGMEEWVYDIVVARGVVHDGGKPLSGFTFVDSIRENIAHLAFNYEGLGAAKELEVLHYSAGENWMQKSEHRVSHLGMHCSNRELEHWKDFFKGRGIGIAQEVNTLTHSNPAIAGKRWYRYCIFDTWKILSVDVKFIVRKESAA